MERIHLNSVGWIFSIFVPISIVNSVSRFSCPQDVISVAEQNIVLILRVAIWARCSPGAHRHVSATRRV